MSRTAPKKDILVLAVASLVPFVLLLAASVLPGYGFFIDELYFIACSRRPALGYVDQPPLSILLLAGVRWLLGDSMVAIRLLPALATAGTVFTTGLVARELGGSRRAMLLAALASMGMPVLLLFGSFYSMNAFEPFLWTLVVLLIVRLVKRDEPRLWVPIGVLIGLSLESKHTGIVYGLALLLGMLASRSRARLHTRWIAYGLLATALLLLPNLVWQFQHGFPSLELYGNSSGMKNIARMPWEVLRDQVLFANPFALPLWLSGLAWLAVGEGGRYRFLAWTWLLLLIAMVVAGSSRPDRIAAIYPALFAAGAVAIDHVPGPRPRTTLAATMAVLLVVGGVAALPICVPILPPAGVRAYLSGLGLKLEVERGKQDEPVPQWLADRLGWREMAVKVAEVYRSLSPEERRHAILVSSNYGHAGALELYGPALGLPPVFGTHNSFHEWGPPPEDATTYIGVSVDRRALERRFDSVVEAAVASCADCTRPQRSVPIYVARGPRFSVRQEWPTFKNYH